MHVHVCMPFMSSADLLTVIIICCYEYNSTLYPPVSGSRNSNNNQLSFYDLRCVRPQPPLVNQCGHWSAGVKKGQVHCHCSIRVVYSVHTLSNRLRRVLDVELHGHKTIVIAYVHLPSLRANILSVWGTYSINQTPVADQQWIWVISIYKGK